MCLDCTIENARERYANEDNRLASLRYMEWRERTTHPDADLVTLRQQRSRLMRQMRPREPVPPGVDPLVLGSEALRELALLKAAILKSQGGTVRFEIVVEAIRRLSWGPGE